MGARQDSKKWFALSRLDVAAILFAVLLSLACLAKGAVYDAVIAILILFMLPVLWLALTSARTVQATLCRVGIVFLSGMVLVLVLQQMMLGSGSDSPWQALQGITGHKVSGSVLHDKAAWMQGIGRLLLVVMTFSISLLIGTSESSARLFLQGLLISGILCLTITFFVVTAGGVPTTRQESFTHGFVNPNNAAAYMGVLLMMVLAQSIRFFKVSVVPFHKAFLDAVDGMSIAVILKGSFLAFSLLLTLAGLFVTGSRAGIVLALICAALLCFLVLQRMNAVSGQRKHMVAGAYMLLSIIIVWIFLNFGEVMTSKLNIDGVSSNSRLDIMAAVVPMIADHPLLGTGLGSFPRAFQHYRPLNVSTDGIIDKAHNSYFEFAAEMGVPALLLLLAVMGWMGLQLYRGFHARKERYIIPALGLSVWLFAAIYSLIDFPLQIPALTALFTAIITVCLSQTDPHFSEPAQPSSPGSNRVRIRKRRGSTKPV